MSDLNEVVSLYTRQRSYGHKKRPRTVVETEDEKECLNPIWTEASRRWRNGLNHRSPIKVATEEPRDEDPRIAALVRIKNNWDGQGAKAPNSLAILIAREVLRRIKETGYDAKRIVRSAPGAVFFLFGDSERYAHIEVFNDGDIVAVTREGKATPLIWGSDLDSIDADIQRIREFVG